MTACALFQLQTLLRIPSTLKVFEPYQYVACIGEELRAKFRIDTANLTPGPANWVERTHPMGFDVLLPQKWREETAPDGSTVVLRSDGQVSARRPTGGYYFDPVNPPLQDVAEPADLEKHKQTIFSFDCHE